MINNKDLKTAQAEMIASYPHQTFATVRFEKSVISEEKALKACLEFVRAVGKHFKTVVAGWAVFNCLGHPHIHLVLFGKTHNISALNDAIANRLWEYGSAVARPYEDRGASEYLVRNMTPNNPKKSLLIPVGIRILKKHYQGDQLSSVSTGAVKR